MENKKLYESIMKDVSKIIKKHLNESQLNESFFSNIGNNVKLTFYDGLLYKECKGQFNKFVNSIDQCMEILKTGGGTPGSDFRKKLYNTFQKITIKTCKDFMKQGANISELINEIDINYSEKYPYVCEVMKYMLDNDKFVQDELM